MTISAKNPALTIAAICILLPIAVAAQTGGQQPSPSPTAATAGANDPKLINRTPTGSDIQIGSGDLLEINAFGTDFTETSRVSETGDVSLPLIGTVHVGGMNTEQARDVIAADLVKGNWYKNPQVTVFIKEYSTQGVAVLGEVAKPGVYPRLGEHRLLDLISAAGGLTPKAGKLITITRRGESQPSERVEYTNDPAKQLSSNVEVRPGDTIFVSQAGIVYVIGDVARPSGFVMDNNGTMTALEALAMAGGTTANAKLGGARLIRKTPAGVQDIPVPMQKIMQAKSEDLALQAGDVLFIPSSAAKSALRRGTEAILQAATGIAIYRRP